MDNIDWNYQSTPQQPITPTPLSPKEKKWSKKGRLSVTFPDGTELSYPNSTKTFLEVIENSFPDLIIEMGIEVNGGNLIHTANDKPRLQEIKGGFFVDVNYRTDVKVQILKKISAELDLNLSVKQLDITESSANVQGNTASTTAIIIPTTSENASKRDRIRVTFPDGHIICKKINKETLVATILRIGVENVFNLKLNAWGNGATPLMSERPIIGYEKSCVQLDENRYLLTNSSTHSKISSLQTISSMLNLGLKIELLEGVNKCKK